MLYLLKAGVDRRADYVGMNKWQRQLETGGGCELGGCELTMSMFRAAGYEGVRERCEYCRVKMKKKRIALSRLPLIPCGN